MVYFMLYTECQDDEKLVLIEIIYSHELSYHLCYHFPISPNPDSLVNLLNTSCTALPRNFQGSSHSTWLFFFFSLFSEIKPRALCICVCQANTLLTSHTSKPLPNTSNPNPSLLILCALSASSDYGTLMVFSCLSSECSFIPTHNSQKKTSKVLNAPLLKHLSTLLPQARP